MGRQRRLAVWVGCLVLSGVCGCANRVDKEEIETWGPRQWKQAQAENATRLLSEDQHRQVVGVQQVNQGWQDFKELVERIYNYATGNTPFNAAKDMVDPSHPDRRRQAVHYFARRSYGRQEPYVDYYTEMARTDADHTVRASAIRALNRSRVAAATPVFINAMQDRHMLVRLEGAKALANVPDAASVAVLIKRLADPDENVDVRIAAADALRNHGNFEAAQALIRALRDREFAISWQARKSLKLMTGQDYGYDQSAWLTYLTEAEKPFG